MVSSATRILHFNNRMVSSQVDPVLSAVNTAAKANYAAYAIEFTALLAAVHNYLHTQGIVPASYFNYDGFAGEIYHISKHFAGASAIAGAAAMVVKWTLFGCTGVQLRAVAALFGIIVP